MIHTFDLLKDQFQVFQAGLVSFFIEVITLNTPCKVAVMPTIAWFIVYFPEKYQYKSSPMTFLFVSTAVRVLV